MPRRLEFTCLILRGEPLWERIALVLQKQLFDVGVDMKVLALPPKDLIPRLGTGDFDALLMETVSARSLAWLYSFWHSKESAKSAFLTTGYSAADAALDRLRHATSDEETRSALAECQRIFFDDPPAVFIAWPQQYRAVTAAFDVQSEPGRDILGSLWQWRPKTDSVARR